MSDALDEVERISDPAVRVLAMSAVMADQAQRNARWKAERNDRVHALKAEGLSFRKIAAQVGVSLGTVQDILRGHTGSWSDRPKAPDGEEAE